MNPSQAQEQMTEFGPDFDPFQARADQIRPTLRSEESRRRLYHEDRQTCIRQFIRFGFDHMTERYNDLGFEIRPEFQSFEYFMLQCRRRQSETVFRREFNSFDDFLFDFHSRRNYDYQFGTFEGLRCRLDLLEEFLFMCDLCRLQADTGLGPEHNPLDGLNIADQVTNDGHSFGQHYYGFGREFAEFRERTSDDRRERRREMIDNLLASLPVVETTTLSEDDQSCPICMDQYDEALPNTAATRSDDNDDITASTAAISSEVASETELAIRLQCNHVLGKTCLERWLMGGKTRCPLCRANVGA